MSVEFWQKQIDRAGELASAADVSNELLVFYGRLLRAQLEVYQFLLNQKDWHPSGVLERDLPVFRQSFSAILKAVEEAGPAALVEQAQSLSTAQSVDELLLSYWHSPSDTAFFAKAFLQPYSLYLSTGETRSHVVERRCPFCGGNPQLSFLQNKEVTAESGNRDLMCARCLTVWPFRRVVCANCGEEEPSKLAYYQAKEIDHVRVEACETCKHYLKGVDLTRRGTAQPLVDEVAAAALDLWATEHGYMKIELNLIGL
ncbi:MAG TPA: formate dehydrogenase accessory protein FdhE [Pyrinomonadaceae bacterium]|nr:formate dehydrogenase accessory protein FdhE [Pyrinomonadaceae bacterium]